MNSVESIISYSVSVFVIVLIIGCIVNLLRKHFILQIAGIAFFASYLFFKSISLIGKNEGLENIYFYHVLLVATAGISACLISMVLGFWLFPAVRRKIR